MIDKELYLLIESNENLKTNNFLIKKMLFRDNLIIYSVYKNDKLLFNINNNDYSIVENRERIPFFKQTDFTEIKSEIQSASRKVKINILLNKYI